MRSAVALAAGAILPLALAPFSLFPLMLVSAGALFWILQRSETHAGAFLAGWLFGVGKYGVGASWIYVSIHVFGAAAPPLAIGLVALFVAGLAVFNGVLGWAFHRVAALTRSAGGLPEAFAFGVLWTTVEWVLTWLLTGFPWLFAGYAFIDTPLVGLAPVGGVLLVSFAAVLTAACLTAVAMTRQRLGRIVMLVVPVVVWTTAWLLQSVSWTERGAARTVALVQANVPQDRKWSRRHLPEWKARYRELSGPVWDRDIVVWPEAAIPDYYHLAKGFIDQTAGGRRGDLVQGTVVAEVDEKRIVTSYNAAVSTGGGIYKKRRLVPFGDYVPFETALRGLIAFFDLPMAGSAPGAESQPLLSAAGFDLAMAICYEIAYPKAVAEHGRGADALVTVSNDTWFGESIGPLQHAEIARMRAIENGKYLLRATNNGVTAIIDDSGKVVDQLPQFEQGVLTGTIHASSGMTPFARFLNLPLFLALIAAALGWVVVALLGRFHATRSDD